MQDEYMDVIHKTFGDSVRTIVPLYETEVRGVTTLERVANDLFR
jgi:hypothetical protein